MAKRIFVLEDDEDISNIFELLLKEENYDLEFPSTFSELKQLMKAGLPDLFMIDVMLPDANGIDICRDLKTSAVTKDIPVIVMSANARSKQMSVQANADDYLAKPFDIEQVISKIKYQLEK